MGGEGEEVGELSLVVSALGKEALSLFGERGGHGVSDLPDDHGAGLGVVRSGQRESRPFRLMPSVRTTGGTASGIIFSWTGRAVNTSGREIFVVSIETGYQPSPGMRDRSTAVRQPGCPERAPAVGNVRSRPDLSRSGALPRHR